ncbi:MAG: L-serine ammonia-lyase, iron-sulfur-dependent, subunit alpha, partial [Calditrichia bacterium]|nr:L-serine ammonia-lyase, iron-sulfur-dependent, subunit alpha [Calditrichia bacterium]
MQTIKEIFRIGFGPSSSHTMAPRRAAEKFKKENPTADKYEVTLFGSLASTGKGHYTDTAIISAFSPKNLKINWLPEKTLPMHPNGMRFKAFTEGNNCIASWEVYSVGGGALKEENEKPIDSEKVYSISKMNDIVKFCEREGISIWEYVWQIEGKELFEYLVKVWDTMRDAIEKGLNTEGVLPGGLGVSRKAWMFNRKAKMRISELKDGILVSSYALAVAEENAGGGLIVTAPTCGAAGVLPGVLKYLQDRLKCDNNSIINALATAGLIGNLIKHNASISGAEVGCQGEIGSACAMAAGATVQLIGGTVKQIEYAAEMG